MDIFSIITLVILIIVLIVSIISLTKVGKFQAGDIDTKKIEDEIRELRKETMETINNTLKTFGSTIAENQKESANQQNESLKQLNDTLHKMTIENEQKLDNIRVSMEEKVSKLTEENNKQLEKMRATVDEKLQETLNTRITESFEVVNKRLGEVYESLGEMKTLAEGVGDLKKVLANVKNRGVFGEAQLAAILDEIMIPEQYDVNVATIPNSSERVEFAIKLPNEGGDFVYLPIDSKFPGDLYERLLDAYEVGDITNIESCKKELAKRIKSEAKDISTKYVQPPYTTQYGIMFLPFEGLYAEVLRLNIASDIQRDFKVTIAGPTTISALLNSLQMGFKTLSIQKHSHEVWRVLGEVKKEFGKFEDILEKIQRKLHTTDKDLDELIGKRTRKINRTLKEVETIGIEGGSAENITLISSEDNISE